MSRPHPGQRYDLCVAPDITWRTSVSGVSDGSGSDFGPVFFGFRFFALDVRLGAARPAARSAALRSSLARFRFGTFQPNRAQATKATAAIDAPATKK